MSYLSTITAAAMPHLLTIADKMDKCLSPMISTHARGYAFIAALLFTDFISYNFRQRNINALHLIASQRPRNDKERTHYNKTKKSHNIQISLSNIAHLASIFILGAFLSNMNKMDRILNPMTSTPTRRLASVAILGFASLMSINFRRKNMSNHTALIERYNPRDDDEKDAYYLKRYSHMTRDHLSTIACLVSTFMLGAVLAKK